MLISTQAAAVNHAYTARMQRQQGVLVLIILILFMLSGWWLFSKYAPQSYTESRKAPEAQKAVLHIMHEQKGSAQMYTGAMMVSDCDLFSAGVEAEGGDVVALTLRLSVARAEDPCSGAATTTPFAVSVEAEQIPTIKSVLVDGKAVVFDVIEKP